MIKQNKFFFISLNELISKYEPAYGDSWESWFNSAFDGEPVRINELIDAIEEKGHFDDPILLISEPKKEEIDGEIYYYSPQVIDGMHRLVTHYLTGNVDKILVQHGNYEFNRQHRNYNKLLTITIAPKDVNDDDEWEKILDYLSFNHRGSKINTWLSPEGSGSSIEEGLLDFYLYCDDDDKDYIVFDEIQDEINERLATIDTKAVKVFFDELNESDNFEC